MNRYLFRGKRKDNNKYIEGGYCYCNNESYIIINAQYIPDTRDWDEADYYEKHPIYKPTFIKVYSETVGQWTGLTDRNGKKIFESDIVQYLTDDDFDCQSVVKLGEYNQDGSGGEYRGRKCIGFYVEVNNFTCPDWYDDEDDEYEGINRLPYHTWQQNILEVASKCEVIGNIDENPEILSN